MLLDPPTSAQLSLPRNMLPRRTHLASLVTLVLAAAPPPAPPASFSQTSTLAAPTVDLPQEPDVVANAPSSVPQINASDLQATVDATQEGASAAGCQPFSSGSQTFAAPAWWLAAATVTWKLLPFIGIGLACLVCCCLSMCCLRRYLCPRRYRYGLDHRHHPYPPPPRGDPYAPRDAHAHERRRQPSWRPPYRRTAAPLDHGSHESRSRAHHGHESQARSRHYQHSWGRSFGESSSWLMQRGGSSLWKTATRGAAPPPSERRGQPPMPARQQNGNEHRGPRRMDLDPANSTTSGSHGITSSRGAKPQRIDCSAPPDRSRAGREDPDAAVRV